MIEVPRRVIEHFDTLPEAYAWARESAYIEGCRFLVRYDRGRQSRKWEAIQSWLRAL